MDDNPLRHLVEDGDVILDLDKATPDDAYDLYDLVWTRSQPNPARLGEVAGMLLDDGVLAVIGGRTTGFDKHFREHGMIGDVAVGRGPLEPERDRINAERRRRKEGIMPNPSWRENAGGVQRQEFHDGSYVLHKLTGNFDGRASAWYDRDGVMLDAEVRRGGGTYPVRRHGPIWNELARAGRVHARRSNPESDSHDQLAALGNEVLDMLHLGYAGDGGPARMRRLSLAVAERAIDLGLASRTGRRVEIIESPGPARYQLPHDLPPWLSDLGRRVLDILAELNVFPDGNVATGSDIVDAARQARVGHRWTPVDRSGVDLNPVVDQGRRVGDIPKRDALVSLGAFVATLPEDEELGGEELGWVADKAIELGLATVAKGMFRPSAAALRVHVTNAPMKAGQDALRVLHDGDWGSHEAGQMAVVVKRAREWANNVMRQRETNPASRPFRIGETVMGIMGVDGGYVGRVARVRGDGRGKTLVTVATDDGHEFETHDFNLTRNVPPKGKFPRRNPPISLEDYEP